MDLDTLQPIQKTDKDLRDVRRVVLEKHTDEVVLHVEQENGLCKIVDRPDGSCQERRVRVPKGFVKEPKRVPPSGGEPLDFAQFTAKYGGTFTDKELGLYWNTFKHHEQIGALPIQVGPVQMGRGSFAGISAEDSEAPRRDPMPKRQQPTSWADVAACSVPDPASTEQDVPGMVALWEWCRDVSLHAPETFALPPNNWGVYEQDNNSRIEKAWLANVPDIGIQVGIRDFKIVFDIKHRGYAEQRDPELRRSRVMRRRLVKPEEQAGFLDVEVPELGYDQTECAMCCLDFEDTPSMAIVVLVPCAHAFHRACAKEVQKKDGECPTCRHKVDWPASMSAAPPTKPKGDPKKLAEEAKSAIMSAKVEPKKKGLFGFGRKKQFGGS